MFKIIIFWVLFGTNWGLANSLDLKISITEKGGEKIVSKNIYGALTKQLNIFKVSTADSLVSCEINLFKMNEDGYHPFQVTMIDSLQSDSLVFSHGFEVSNNINILLVGPKYYCELDKL